MYVRRLLKRIRGGKNRASGQRGRNDQNTRRPGDYRQDAFKETEKGPGHLAITSRGGGGR